MIVEKETNVAWYVGEQLLSATEVCALLSICLCKLITQGEAPAEHKPQLLLWLKVKRKSAVSPRCKRSKYEPGTSDIYRGLRMTTRVVIVERDEWKYIFLLPLLRFGNYQVCLKWNRSRWHSACCAQSAKKYIWMSLSRNRDPDTEDTPQTLLWAVSRKTTFSFTLVKSRLPNGSTWSGDQQS